MATDSAFILAAGFGTRMMPLTKDKPKPMVSIFGKPIIEHTLDHLKNAGVRNVTINGHYKPESLSEYLNTRNDLNITFIKENKILNTGGGIMNGLHTMPDDAPFFIINGDAFWMPGDTFILKQMNDNWIDNKMDMLLLLQEKTKVREGSGDYDINDSGHAIRNKDKSGTYMFSGIRLCHKRCLSSFKVEDFSFRDCMDKAESDNRLYAVANPGEWYHLSTPQDITALEDIRSVKAHGL